MNYGFQLSASGTLSNLYRMDVLANNLSNATTIGFKPDRVAFVQRDVAAVEDDLALPSSKLLERLGGGVHPAANRTSFEQGSISQTGNPLDLAIQGEGFFVLEDSSNGGGERFNLTRDGRFTRDASGQIVSATTGQPLMDVGNRPIFLPGNGAVTIDAAGNVRQSGAVLGRVQIADIDDRTQLRKMGHGMFSPTAEGWSARTTGTGIVTQNAVEEASVDPIAMMMQITDAGRAAESNMGMVSNHDRLLERAINTFGRVS